jgi:hypothetical protein
MYCGGVKVKTLGKQAGRLNELISKDVSKEKIDTPGGTADKPRWNSAQVSRRPG